MKEVCDVCGSSVFNSVTGLCATCSKKDAYDFRTAWRNGTDTDDKLSNKVLELLRTGKKWRVLSDRNKVCWHPGVKMTNGKCVFCSLLEKESNAPSHDSGIDVAIATVTQEIEQMNTYLMLLNTYKALGASTVPERPQTKSPRQQAIADGKRWYIPYEPCKHCNTISERYVANGKCRNCGR
jgi:hypothetical protein